MIRRKTCKHGGIIEDIDTLPFRNAVLLIGIKLQVGLLSDCPS
jgi:hypothetical protein